MQGTIDLRPAISGSEDRGVWSLNNQNHNFTIIDEGEYSVVWDTSEEPTLGREEIETRIINLAKQFFGNCNTK